MHVKKRLFGFLLGVLSLSTHALTLDIRFTHSEPPDIDFTYAISSGDCINQSAAACHYEHGAMTEIPGSSVFELIKWFNSQFNVTTPTADKSRQSTNYVEIKIHDQQGLCHIDVLGKTNIIVYIQPDGTCASRLT
jgi:hypothetical protein